MTTMKHEPRVSGKELQLERVRLDVRVGELAEAMGYTHGSGVTQIESQRRVTPRMAARYREALATFATVATGEAA
jgi:plasmid maintenance system antidote protein VapI